MTTEEKLDHEKVMEWLRRALYVGYPPDNDDSHEEWCKIRNDFKKYKEEYEK